MHLEVREVKNGKKYYLAHSYRENGSVKKLRFYLGKNLSEKELREKRKEGEKVLNERIKALEMIGDPFHTILSPRETKELKNLEDSVDFNIIHLSEDDWEEFTKDFVYDTNAIEGSTVTRGEVEQILEEDKWPDKSKWEISETYGLENAVEYIRKTNDHISMNLIKELHGIVFKNSKSFAGELRKEGEEVAVIDSKGNVVHRGAPPTKVKDLLKELMNWYDKNKDNYSPLVLASVIHNQFETIHPFKDGNGRVGRLLLNNILLKHGYPPVDIELENRKEYYNTLHEYQNKQNLRPTIELLLKEYRNMKNKFG